MYMYLAGAQTLPTLGYPVGRGRVHPPHIPSPPLYHNVKYGRIPPGTRRNPFILANREPEYRPHVNPGFGFVFFATLSVLL